LDVGDASAEKTRPLKKRREKKNTEVGKGCQPSVKSQKQEKRPANPANHCAHAVPGGEKEKSLKREKKGSSRRVFSG